MRLLVTLTLMLGMALPALAAEVAPAQQLSAITGFGSYLFGQPFADFDIESLRWY